MTSEGNVIASQNSCKELQEQLAEQQQQYDELQEELALTEQECAAINEEKVYRVKPCMYIYTHTFCSLSWKKVYHC